MIDVSKVKLGKKAAVHDPRTLRLADYVTNALKPSPRRDWSTKVTGLTMMLNDSLGDCTIAAYGHMVQTWTANNGSQVILPDSAILAGYEGACGYNPADPSTDQGGVEVTVLNYMRQTGLGGHKLYAYVAQEPGNKTHVELSVDLLGGCYLGLELPRSIQGQRVWSVPPGGPVGDGAPGSLGGHAVPAVAYGPAGITVITWGQLLTMTWKFFSVYCSESYGVLSPDWANGAKLAPSGFDLAALQADLAAITG
jgi:hypothetical protein